jgi:DNA polymerase III subunit gamma/tau
MDRFIVSARKYRPQTFDTVVGQSHITTTLKNAIRHNQLAHAFLFCGPRGVGKTTCARILAKTINCENQSSDGEACNICNSCKSFNEGTSLNIHELDAASNNSVDDIRTLVEQVRFSPQAGRYKVYIIDEVHMLSSSAFNAFLKTLEEPPPYAIFILATTEKHKILPTILSRCQIFDFKRITINDTVAHLKEICNKEDIKAETAALQVIAQKSEGCLRDALSILDKIVSFTNGEVNYSNTLEHLNILDADYYFRLMNCMLQQDLSGAMLLYDDINRKGFEGDLVLNGFAEFTRNLLVCRDEKVAILLEVVESFKEKYFATAKKTSPAFLISALNILSEAEINYKAARNKRLHVELALIKLCYLQQALELNINESGSLVKKKVIETAKPVAYRQIVPLQVHTEKKKPAEPKPEPVKEKVLQLSSSQDDAKLMIEVAVEEKINLGTLTKIRNQFKPNGSSATGLTQQPLQQEELQITWNLFVQKIKEENNSASQSFELATLRIKSENSIEVIVSNNLQQKFIEKERTRVCEFLQQKLNNKSIQLSVIIESNGGDPKMEAPLTAREQYLKIVEQYPLVKELKDRLRLELDY